MNELGKGMLVLTSECVWGGGPSTLPCALWGGRPISHSEGYQDRDKTKKRTQETTQDSNVTQNDLEVGLYERVVYRVLHAYLSRRCTCRASNL